MVCKIEPLKILKQHAEAELKTFNTPKERVEDITEMILSMCVPCVERSEVDEDWEDSVCSKIKNLFAESKKPLRLPPGGYEEAMQMKFEGESALFSNETAEEMKRTLKAHYMLAGGLTDDFQRLSEELREREEEQICIVQEDIETRDSHFQDEPNVTMNETIETAAEIEEFGGFMTDYAQSAPTLSYGQFRVEELLLRESLEREAKSRRKWQCKDYTKAAIGCSALAVVLFGAYRFIR